GRHFVGYSFMEDVDLSVRIARRWKLVAHTGAQAYHDSQPSRFKRPFTKSKMCVENQYYVMAKTLGRTSPGHHYRFLANFVVSRLTGLRAIKRPADAMEQLQSWCGGICGLFQIARTRA